MNYLNYVNFAVLGVLIFGIILVLVTQSSSIRQLQDGLRNLFDSFSSNQAQQSRHFSEVVSGQMTLLTRNIEELKKENARSMIDLQLLVNNELDKMRQDNDEKLEKIRKSVDDQLQSTLQKSVRQSFESVSQQLQQVYEGLGEMQILAKDVGGLKKILGNVKTRGNFGEVQLETILDEIIPSRYQKQVMIQRNSQDRVDFAIQLPGENPEERVLLPIDSKFPAEAYDKLQAAREQGDKDGIDQAMKELRSAVKGEAKSIHDKYIQLPKTTAFAIMFLAAESIYAAVISQTDLVNEIRRELQVNIAGPSTMAAFLNSIQMGFHTLQLQESAGKINEILQNAKTQFGKFEEVLRAMQKRMQQNDAAMEELLTTRTNGILRALRSVEVQEEQGTIGR